jgi:hypothetical protein
MISIFMKLTMVVGLMMKLTMVVGLFPTGAVTVVGLRVVGLCVVGLCIVLLPLQLPSPSSASASSFVGHATSSSAACHRPVVALPLHYSSLGTYLQVLLLWPRLPQFEQTIGESSGLRSPRLGMRVGLGGRPAGFVRAGGRVTFVRNQVSVNSTR